MRTAHLLVGGLAGLTLGLGGVVAADLATESAEAQGGSSKFVTRAEFEAANASANQRASAAINGYKIANNALTKYFLKEGELIGAGSGPITQDRGTGANGLPGSTIQDGAISRQKVANAAIDSQKIAPGGVTNGDLANESVTSTKIAPGGVTSGDLANESVTSEKITPGGVTSGDLADASVTNAKIQTGAVSEAKLSSAVQTKLNTTGVSGLEEVTFNNDVTINSGDAQQATLACPTGKVAISGGVFQTFNGGGTPFAFANAEQNIQVVGSARQSGGGGWVVQLENPTATAAQRTYNMRVLCATPGS